MMHELKIAAVSGRWRLFMIRKNDPAFEKYRDAIFERDDYTCQFCGFKNRTAQEVANIDGNYANNKRDNLVTACCFCSQCFFLDAVGIIDNTAGKLVYLPEISQQDLNGLCHILFCAMNERMVNFGEAKDLYLTLQERSNIVTEHLGQGMDDPMSFGKLMINLSDQMTTEMQNKILPALRLLPNYQAFRHLVGVWSNDAFKGFGDASYATKVGIKDVKLLEEHELMDDLD